MKYSVFNTLMHAPYITILQLTLPKLYRISGILKAIGSTDPNLKILVNSFAICKTNVEKIHISINIVEEQHGKLDLKTCKQ